MSSQLAQTAEVSNNTPVIAPGEQAREQQHPRLLFIENLRTCLTALVIVHHLAVTYGGPGSWYYQEPAKDLVTRAILTVMVATGQAFALGCFFLISAYFTPGAYDRKGAGVFLRDRLLRLGIPLLLYDLLIHPLVTYMAAGLPSSYWSFWSDYLLHINGIGHGPPWFIEALLLFTAVYAFWRWLTGNRSPARTVEENRPPRNRSIVLSVLALAVATFLIRLWFPIDWVFRPLNLQFPFFAQYVSLFIIGLIASRRNWFLTLSDRMGTWWLRVGLLAIPLFVVLALVGDLAQQSASFKGGLHWQAFAAALWESLVCVSLCIGLLVLFRSRFNHQGSLARGCLRAPIPPI